MKGIDIFCASQSATAISSSTMEHDQQQQPSSSSSATVLLGGGGGGRAIDRHNPIIRDSRRIPKSFAPCNTPQSPISPKPHKKSSSSTTTTSHSKIKIKSPLKENYTEIKKCDNSSLNIDDDNKPPDSVLVDDNNNNTNNKKKKNKDIIKPVRKSWSCTRPGEFISPPGSTRYLLGDDNKVLVSAVSDLDSKLKLFDEVEDSKTVLNKAVKTAEKPMDVNEVPEKTCVSPDQPQVVVLRVSLHCRGCERKMRKHISRMEGVTSFNIDFLAKKVTVEGNVTPLGVLSSISKVKNAQLWSPTISSTTPASVSLKGLGPVKNEETKGADAKVGDKEGVFLPMAVPPSVKLV